MFKGKLAYTTPVMSEEVFEADEYVAACWGVACAYGQQGGIDVNTPDVSKRPEVTHGMTSQKTGCGYKDHQYIVVDGTGNVSMKEIETDGLNTLNCTITNSNWQPITLNENELQTGSVIYWTTSADNRTWHHQGTVDFSGNSSNHS